jgi:hypothetical protein
MFYKSAGFAKWSKAMHRVVGDPSVEFPGGLRRWDVSSGTSKS